MKYKEGNKVRIKNIDWYNENKNEYGDVYCGAYTFTYGMTKFCGEIVTILHCYNHGCYTIKEDDNDYTFTSEMIEGLAEEEMSLDKAGQITDFEYEGLAYTLPDGYIFKDENGNEIFTSKIILEKKKKEYPTTYEECLKVLSIEGGRLMFNNSGITQYERELYAKMNNLSKLLICRDAYWKLYGEKMRLGKPWEPDFRGVATSYVITVESNKILKSWTTKKQVILAFPTEEIRDTFKENFDPYIAICKEFL